MKYVLIALEDEVQASFLSRLLALHQRSRRASDFKVAHSHGRSVAELLAMEATLVTLEIQEAAAFFAESSRESGSDKLDSFVAESVCDINSLPDDVMVIWLRDECMAQFNQDHRAIHSPRVIREELPDWVSRVDLVVDKKDLSVVTSNELLLIFDLGEPALAQLDGIITLRSELFSKAKLAIQMLSESCAELSLEPVNQALLEQNTELISITSLGSESKKERRVELWIERQLSMGCRWIELRSDLLNEAQLMFAAARIPAQRRLWSVRNEAHAPIIRKLHAYFKGEIDWTLEPGSSVTCWVEPRFLSIRSRNANQSVSDVLKLFPRVLEEGTQLHAEFAIHSLAELVELENWRRVFAVARVTNPVSSNGRWQWFRLLRGKEHPLSYFTDKPGLETECDNLDRPGFLNWVRRRHLQKSERNRHGQIFFAAQVLQLTEAHVDVPVLSAKNGGASHPHYHAEFFARFAAPLFEVKLTANELRRNGLQNLSGFGLRWAQLDSNLAILEDANTWVFDHSTFKWRGKWIDVTPREDFIVSSANLLGYSSKLKMKPVRAQHEFWNRAYDESED